MDSTEGSPPAVTLITEITVSTGDRHRVQAGVKEVERTILDAARGSLMQFAWFAEAETNEEIGVNPEHVVTLRAVGY